MNENTLEVRAIKNGTVIDHIPADSVLKVISILGLDKVDKKITFGTNLESKKFGQKGIIKIAELFFPDEDINRIALVAPQAKLNIIRGFQVVEKKLVSLPDEISGIVRCMNPQCITNHEQILTKFKVISKTEVKLKCKYCEKITDQNHMTIV